jgi:hypothetical protein
MGPSYRYLSLFYVGLHLLHFNIKFTIWTRALLCSSVAYSLAMSIARFFQYQFVKAIPPQQGLRGSSAYMKSPCVPSRETQRRILVWPGEDPTWRHHTSFFGIAWVDGNTTGVPHVLHRKSQSGACSPLWWHLGLLSVPFGGAKRDLGGPYGFAWASKVSRAIVLGPPFVRGRVRTHQSCVASNCE